MKIDRAFVCDQEDGGNVRVIVKSILHMAKAGLGYGGTGFSDSLCPPNNLHPLL